MHSAYADEIIHLEFEHSFIPLTFRSLGSRENAPNVTFTFDYFVVVVLFLEACASLDE